MSLGEHTAHPRQLQHNAGVCHHRLAPHSVPRPPPGLSEPEPSNQLLLYPILSERRTDALRWPTHRSRAKYKVEPKELCEQRREREISPSSLRSSGLNLHNQLVVPCICGIPE